jgi:hypothetical protein
MWVMIMVGIGLAAVFVFALRSQINAYKLGQAEEQLKEKLDQYATRQKFLTLDQQRALNTSESDRAGRAGGLNQLKLDQQSATHVPSSGKGAHQVSDPVGQDPEPVRKSSELVERNSDPGDQPQAAQKGNNQEAPRSIKQLSKPSRNASNHTSPGQTAPSHTASSQSASSRNAKVAEAAKAGKVMKVVKIVKPSAARSNLPKTGVAKASAPKAGPASSRIKAGALKAKKQSDNQKQSARSHPRR